MDTNGNYIQNQFCSYEIALKLKELGFGMDDYLQLPFYYDKEGNLHLMEVCVSKKHNPSPNHLGANTIDDFDAKLSWVDNSLDEIYLAPLYQQVIDWFREKHKYSVSIHVDEDNSTPSNIKYWYCIDSFFEVPNNKIVREGIEEVGNFSSYQEAREQAILKAIKLIKK